MAPDDLERFLSNVDRGRRNFLKQIIAGAAFAPPLIASFSLEGPSVTPAEASDHLSCYPGIPGLTFDFSGTQYADHFTGILRPALINPGTDLADGGQSSLNFTGSTGSGGGTWMTLFDSPTPIPEAGCALSLSADVLFHTFNNMKGAGLLALFNVGAGEQGVAVLVSDAGNTDKFQLVTVDQAGKPTVLPASGPDKTNLPLGSSIAENLWYRLTMDINVIGPNVAVIGNVFRHTVPTDPDSDPEPASFGTVRFSGALPTGVPSSGQVGLVARAVSAVVNLSVTNFHIESDDLT